LSKNTSRKFIFIPFFIPEKINFKFKIVYLYSFSSLKKIRGYKVKATKLIISTSLQYIYQRVIGHRKYSNGLIINLGYLGRVLYIIYIFLFSP